MNGCGAKLHTNGILSREFLHPAQRLPHRRWDNKECMELLGLYLSVPFCRSKCTYCNFSSGVFSSAYHQRYVARLEEDLASIRLRAKGWGATLPQAADSIYLGGGTPSLLAHVLLRHLL